jgi:hypothetical protein
MPDRRRIVPDTSVVLPGFFKEELHGLDLTRRALPLVHSIRSRAVIAFAPLQLLHEFMKRSYDKAFGRSSGELLDPQIVDNQVREFLKLDIDYWRAHYDDPAGPMAQALEAWQYAHSLRISVADSWFLACAVRYDAELWVSHEHEDGFVDKARKIHPKVHTLAAEAFKA